jgi:hypothetical protein
MSHTSTLSQENHWNNCWDEWKLPLYFSKPALHHIKHFVDGMLSTGYTGTLTDIHRESLQERDRRTLSHFLIHGNWDASCLERVVQRVAFQHIQACAQRERSPMFVILDDTVCEKPSLRHRPHTRFKGLRFNILISSGDMFTGTLSFKRCFAQGSRYFLLPQRVMIHKEKVKLSWLVT